MQIGQIAHAGLAFGILSGNLAGAFAWGQIKGRGDHVGAAAVCHLQYAAFLGHIFKQAAPGGNRRVIAAQNAAVLFDEGRQHGRVRFAHLVADIDGAAADSAQHAADHGGFMLRPPHIVIADEQLIVENGVIGVLHQMVNKAALLIGEEIVAVPGNGGIFAEEFILVGHAHAVNQRPGEIQLHGGLQRLVGGAGGLEGGVVAQIENPTALVIHLQEIHPLIAQIPVPGVIEIKGLLEGEARHQMARFCFGKRGGHFPGQGRIGMHAVPIGVKGVPHAHLADAILLMGPADKALEPLGEFLLVFGQGGEPLILYAAPSVVDNHPADGQIFFLEFLQLVFQPLRRYIPVKGVPAAPAKVFHHFGVLLFRFRGGVDQMRFHAVGKGVLHCREGIRVAGEGRQRAAQAIQAVLVQMRAQAQALGAARKIGFKSIAHQGQNERMGVLRLGQQHLRFFRHVLQARGKGGGGPPGLFQIIGQQALLPGQGGNIKAGAVLGVEGGDGLKGGLDDGKLQPQGGGIIERAQNQPAGNAARLLAQGDDHFVLRPFGLAGQQINFALIFQIRPAEKALQPPVGQQQRQPPIFLQNQIKHGKCLLEPVVFIQQSSGTIAAFPAARGARGRYGPHSGGLLHPPTAPPGNTPCAPARPSSPQGPPGYFRPA